MCDELSVLPLAIGLLGDSTVPPTMLCQLVSISCALTVFQVLSLNCPEAPCEFVPSSSPGTISKHPRSSAESLNEDR